MHSELNMDILFSHYPELKPLKEDLQNALNLFKDTYKNGGKVLVCGNGGSCADCEHIVGELMKGFLSTRPISEKEKSKFTELFDDADYFNNNLQGALPAISLPSQCGILSAFNNDVDPDLVYAQLAYGYGNENDLIIGLSTSGNSKNVINAFKAAKAKNMKTLGFCGKNQCKMDENCNVVLHAPHTDTYRIQEYHLPMYHWLCAEIEKVFFK